MMKANHSGHTLNIRSDSDVLAAQATVIELRPGEADLSAIKFLAAKTFGEVNAIYKAIAEWCKDYGFIVLSLRTDKPEYLEGMVVRETALYCFEVLLYATGV